MNKKYKAIFFDWDGTAVTSRTAPVEDAVVAMKPLLQQGTKLVIDVYKRQLLKSSMAFVTAEYLSTDEGKGFGEKYRNGEVTMDGTWNPYIETWSQLH